MSTALRRRLQHTGDLAKAFPRVHFVGIGGTGMSGTAEVMCTLGYQVSGSDMADNAVTRRLASMGATVHRGHAAANVLGADCVVVSSAIKRDNPELMEARAQRIPVVPRAEMLAELMRFRRGIAVAGTHGKTTTTSLTASVLAEGGIDPTFVIGGKLLAAGANAGLGGGQWLEFLHRLPFYGLAVLCIDDANVARLAAETPRHVMTYGFSDEADVRAEDVTQHGGAMRFTLCLPDASRTAVTLALPGRHNVLNALAAASVAWQLGVASEAIARALEKFAGIGRRFNLLAQIKTEKGATVQLVDDYGHHPKELEAVFAAARGGWPDKRLVVAFQPHRYSRTRDLFDDFAAVLSSVDALVLTEVYPAGEAPIAGADAKSLARAIRARGRIDPVVVGGAADLAGVLPDVLNDGDLLLLMGAGDIGAAAQQLATTGFQGESK